MPILPPDRGHEPGRSQLCHLAGFNQIRTHEAVTYKIALICAFLALSTLGLYRRVLFGDFVNFDCPVLFTSIEPLRGKDGIVFEIDYSIIVEIRR